MKLEKMNEQQIRCTLTKEDLMSRHIKINELAYGTDKARSLFREMMIQAEVELGFEAGDIPLMIEAVPIDSETIVLTVTKVEDPEELDTRFAQFSPALLNEVAENSEEYPDFELPVDGDPLDIFKQIADTPNIPTGAIENITRLFSFSSMGELIDASKIVSPEYNGPNSVYKNPKSGNYLLLLGQADMEITAFNRICNIISEYGESEKNLLATAAFLDEHYELILGDRAIQQLCKI